MCKSEVPVPKEEHPVFQARIRSATTRVVKIVFPSVTNHYDTLFGGTALQWMDEVAAIASIRFSRQQTVTVSLDKIDFQNPIPSGCIVELVARVIEVGRTSMKVRVNVYKELRDHDNREKAISGVFTFVAINSEKQPIRIEWDRPLPDDLPELI